MRRCILCVVYKISYFWIIREDVFFECDECGYDSRLGLLDEDGPSFDPSPREYGNEF